MLWYHVRTVLFGLIGLPMLASFLIVLGTALVPDRGWTFPLSTVLSAAVAFSVCLLRARDPGRPTTWLSGLLPVAAAPAAYLLAWMIGAAAVGLGPTLESSWLTGWGILTITILLIGLPPTLLPVVLIATLLGSVAGHFVGARRPPVPTGRRWLAGVVAAVIALCTAAGVQIGQQLTLASLLDSQPAVSDEVELWRYQPFTAGSLLARPAAKPTLQIATDFPKLDGATALYPVYGAVGQAIYAPPGDPTEFAYTYLPCNTTSKAYQRLITGEADAIFVAQPSKGQLERAKQAGVTLDLHPIGREAFVFFVNADNPVRDLTLDQVRDIYSGQITNWNQVGGPDQRITAFQRPEDSGSQTAMQALVMRDRPMAQPLKEEVAEGMGGIISRVADYRNLSGAIGYSFRWYATVMNANPAIRLVSIDGVAPTVETIRDGSYPLTGDLNVVTAGSTNPNLPALLKWLTSAEGKALIEQAGYVAT